jgi:hypothetical protein
LFQYFSFSFTRLKIQCLFTFHKPDNLIKTKFILDKVNLEANFKREKNMASFEIYLSCENKNVSFMTRLQKKLQSKYGLKIWSIGYNTLKTDKTKILAEKAIYQSEVFICGMTKKYTETKDCIDEILLANDRQMPGICLLLEPTVPQNFPGLTFINNWPKIKLYDDLETENSKLIGPNYELLIDKLELFLKRKLRAPDKNKIQKNDCCVII